jgi:FlaA1/EpsC-like NDP-sugar epimerase
MVSAHFAACNFDWPGIMARTSQPQIFARPRYGLARFDPDEWSRTHKCILLIGLDAILVAVSFVLAVLMTGKDVSLLLRIDLWASQLAFAIAAILTFSYFGLYRAITRFITGKVVPIIVAGTSVGVGMGSLAALVLGAHQGLGLALVQGLLLLLAVTALRFGVRTLMLRPVRSKCAPVIIYGAGNAGQQLVAALHLGMEYRPVAFVDDDPKLTRATINGVRVHAPGELRAIIDRWGVREVLLAMPSANRMRRRRIVSRLEALGVQVRTIPGMGDLVSGRARYTDLRPVTPEDLLGRDPVPPDPELMALNITDKVVMVTGAGGSIGSELCRQILAQRPRRLVMVDISEYALYAIATQLRDASGGKDPRLVPLLGSVQDKARMRSILRGFKVDTIYHAAAYKHVAMVEENLIEGIFNNVFGTKTIADAAVAAGVSSFILVSSDKTVRPTNVMGASKRLAELICQAHAALPSNALTTFSIVRFGNVLGSSGSVIPRFREQIERGGPVTVTHPSVTRYFMTLTEAAQLVIQAGAMAKGGDVFVLDMGKPVKILDLAKSMIRQYGLTPFMIDDDHDPNAPQGDVGIKITGLGNGEKLFEELLIGDNPQGSAHPRIMTASEISLAQPELLALLEGLHAACRASDLSWLQRLLLTAPLGYTPKDERIHDLTWQMAPQPQKGSLRIVT